MASDDNDPLRIRPGNTDDDYLDLETVDDEGGGVDEAVDADDAGGEDDASSYDFDEPQEKKGKPVALKNFLAPALVLAAAGGIGGYFLMNSGFSGGRLAETSAPPPVATPETAAVMDITASPDSPGTAASSVTPPPSPPIDQLAGVAEGDVLPPQPVPSVNEQVAEEQVSSQVPRLPAESPPVVTESLPVPESGSTVADPSAPAAPSEPDLSGATPAVMPPSDPAAVAPTADSSQSVPVVAPDSPSEPLAPAVSAVDPVSSPEPVAPLPPTTVAETVVTPPPMPAVETPAMMAGAEMSQGSVVADFPAIGSGTALAVSQDSSPAAQMSASGTANAQVSLKDIANAGPDVYYDGRMNVPTGPLATAVGPRKLNPEQEPASKFVVVTKNHAAQDPESLLISASRALKLERYEAAAEMFDELYRKNPRDARILMGRAVALQKTGRPEAALSTYEDLLRIDPDNTEALVNMMGLLRGQYPEVALRRLMDLQKKYPENAAIAAQAGIAQADAGYLEDALRYLGVAASVEPRNAQHLFNMAVIAERAKKTQDAVKYYEQALETDAVYGKPGQLPREQIYDRLSVLRRQ